MLSAFICANIYGALYVCQVRMTRLINKQVVYEVLLTDNKWYKVNKCTAEKAVIGTPHRNRFNSIFCTR